MFELDSRLQNDTVLIGSFELCDALLMNDANYPWVILVPRREDVMEVHHLSEADQQELLSESVFVAGKMQVNYQADKMNVAALGNVVSQLHVHHIARYQKDIAWPKPVWGEHPAKPYTEGELEAELGALRALFYERLKS